MLSIGLLTLSLVATVRACGDHDDGHSHALAHVRRAQPAVPVAPPSRPLEWGDLNIIHTTDSHGWLLGHQKETFPEPNYRCVLIILKQDADSSDGEDGSGDFGDFFSFVNHMKEIAKVC